VWEARARIAAGAVGPAAPTTAMGEDIAANVASRGRTAIVSAGQGARRVFRPAQHMELPAAVKHSPCVRW
jgi:hypothetical protein